MEKLLTQETIDRMVRAARGASQAARDPDVRPWDALKGGSIRQDQLRALDLVHETFARGLSNSLSAYLRISVEVTLVSAEYLPYGDFLQRFPEGSYLASCKLTPLQATALIEIDSSLALPVVDLLLGGQGKAQNPSREITEIEEELLASVTKIVCGQLQASWRALGVEFSFAQRQPAAEAQRLMNMEEQTFSLSFEIHMGDGQGTLNVAIPALASQALLRKLSGSRMQNGPRVSSETKQRMQSRLLLCPFEIELAVEHLRVPVRELADLAEGQLLVFRQPVGSGATVRISQMRFFSAEPARRQSTRAALITPAAQAGADADKESR
jgi:flagellar motor switch protein FliM